MLAVAHMQVKLLPQTGPSSYTSDIKSRSLSHMANWAYVWPYRTQDFWNISPNHLSDGSGHRKKLPTAVCICESVYLPTGPIDRSHLQQLFFNCCIMLALMIGRYNHYKCKLFFSLSECLHIHVRLINLWWQVCVRRRLITSGMYVATHGLINRTNIMLYFVFIQKIILQIPSRIYATSLTE